MNFLVQKLAKLELSGQEARALTEFTSQFFMAAHQGKIYVNESGEKELRYITCHCVSVLDELSRHARLTKKNQKIKLTLRIQEVESIQHYMDYAVDAVKSYIHHEQGGEYKLRDQEMFSTVQGVKLKARHICDSYSTFYDEDEEWT